SDHNIMYVQRVGGGSFSAPASVYAGSTNDSRRPDVALDSAGTLHMVWVEGTAPNRDIYYATRTSAGVISAASNLSSTPAQDENNPRIHVDSTGRVHVCWEGATATPPATTAIFYRRTSGSVFAAVQTLPFATGGVAAESPDVATDAGDLVYVVWAESNGTRRNIRMMRSDDNGANFGNVASGYVAGGSTDMSEPRVACGALGDVYAVFSAQDSGGDRGVYFAYTRTGGTFVAPVAMYTSATGGARSPYVALHSRSGGGDTVIVAFNDGAAGGGSILVRASHDSGANWPGDPVNLSQGNCQPATNRLPVLAMDDNEVAAGWDGQPTGGGVVRTFSSISGYTLP
ncbi:MAG: exo-alpha-sialidase, partial [Planctomycetes bacterium]|nr:exo-alpha-sialidase [Planctomycetota bacterium]